MKKLKIIVCGSIGYSDIEDIKNVQKLLIKNNFNVIDHISKNEMDYSNINDFRNKPEIVKKIVEHDLNYIKKCDVIVVILNKPSIGTSIEMVYAKENMKKVILLAENKVPTPWPIYYSDYIVKNKKELIKILRRLEKCVL